MKSGSRPIENTRGIAVFDTLLPLNSEFPAVLSAFTPCQVAGTHEVEALSRILRTVDGILESVKSFTLVAFDGRWNFVPSGDKPHRDRIDTVSRVF